MKIVMPFKDGQLNPHFGTSQEFVVVELEQGKATNQQIVSAEGLQHDHGGLAGMVKGLEVDVVITGGIGGHMLKALEQTGIKVVPGAAGDIKTVAESYAAGTLETKVNICGCGGNHKH